MGHSVVKCSSERVDDNGQRGERLPEAHVISQNASEYIFHFATLSICDDMLIAKGISGIQQEDTKIRPTKKNPQEENGVSKGS
jgi:hypothetical protein